MRKCAQEDLTAKLSHCTLGLLSLSVTGTAATTSHRGPGSSGIGEVGAGESGLPWLSLMRQSPLSHREGSNALQNVLRSHGNKISDSVALSPIFPLLPAVPPQRPCRHARGVISPLGGWKEYQLTLSLCLSHLLSGCFATRSWFNLKSCTEPPWAGLVTGDYTAQPLTRGLCLPTLLTRARPHLCW